MLAIQRLRTLRGVNWGLAREMRGDSFTQAFENRMGLSVSQYEAGFFEIVMQYLE